MSHDVPRAAYDSYIPPLGEGAPVRRHSSDLVSISLLWGDMRDPMSKGRWNMRCRFSRTPVYVNKWASKCGQLSVNPSPQFWSKLCWESRAHGTSATSKKPHQWA